MEELLVDIFKVMSALSQCMYHNTKSRSLYNRSGETKYLNLSL